MKFHDGNTLEDIHGLILTLSADVSLEAPEFPIGPRSDELIVRIEEKLSRNSNVTRANWFEIALGHAKKAKSCFEARDAAGADSSLRKCWEYLEEGNKAHRRKTAFVVTPDGTAIPVKKK